MKKLFLSLALASAVAFANAQDMTSKKGVPILPEAGDWSIGFDVTPVLRTIGNVFHPGGSGGPYSQTTNTLVALYVKDDNTAYRAKLRIGFGSSTSGNALTNHSDSINLAKETTQSGMNITIGGGLQKTRGKGRLRGIYGAELGVMLGGAVKTTYEYALPITATDQPTAGSRPTETSTGSSFGISLNGFIGAEFFFAPKMSLSAEYGWGLITTSGGPGLLSTGESENTSEMWDTATSTVKTTTTKGPKSSSFSVDVMNAGSIVFHCYF